MPGFVDQEPHAWILKALTVSLRKVHHWCWSSLAAYTQHAACVHTVSTEGPSLEADGKYSFLNLNQDPNPLDGSMKAAAHLHLVDIKQDETCHWTTMSLKKCFLSFSSRKNRIKCGAVCSGCCFCRATSEWRKNYQLYLQCCLSLSLSCNKDCCYRKRKKREITNELDAIKTCFPFCIRYFCIIYPTAKANFPPHT